MFLPIIINFQCYPRLRLVGGTFGRELVRYCLQNQFLIIPNEEALLENQQGFTKSDLPYFA
jgi:hypothetical protein